MRLPQSIIECLSLRLIHLSTISLAIILGLLPANGAAATSQLTCTPTTLPFGATIVGQPKTLQVAMTNSGPSSITVSSMTLDDSEFSISGLTMPLVIAAGQSVDVSVNFTPASAGWKGARLTIISNASIPILRLQAGGSGVASQPVSASPASALFGQVGVGTSSTIAVVLTNTRPWNMCLTKLQTRGSGFSTSGPSFPLTLPAGKSATLNVTFTPQSSGAAAGSISISGVELTIPLAGTGSTSATGQLIINPGSTNFGNVMVGTTTTQPITLAASGASVIVSSAASSSSQFVLDGASFPLTIPPGQNLSFNVAFTPQASGNATGTLSFVSNASDAKALASLSGTGMTPQYNVSLSWSPSTSSVAGYNVYRRASSTGPYSKVNTGVNPSTAYSDGSVVSGQTYYYAATAVSSSGGESTYSTPVLVKVP